MDQLSYVASVRDAFQGKSEYALMRTPSANYTGEIRPVVSCHGKLLCMNVKQPHMLRLLNREGKFSDLALLLTSVRHLSSTGNAPSHPTFFYAVGDKSVSVVSSAAQANGNLQVSEHNTTLPEELYAATAGGTGRLFVLGQQHVFELEELTGEIMSSMSLVPKTVINAPVFDFHFSAQLLMAPAKSACIDLVSTQIHKSVLSKMWEPHGDAAPTFARFFQTHSFSDEAEGELLLVTAARGNTEVRFWTFNPETKRFSLKQQLHVTPEDNNTVPYFDISVTRGEEYITLCSRQAAYAVVVETHRTRFKAYRVTTWKTPGPALCSTTYVGKVAESARSKSVNYELFITIRTTDGFYQCMLDANKLAGASNTASMQPHSVSNWFAEASVSHGEVVGSTHLTSVSSSLLGDKTTNAISQASAARIIRQQADKFCSQIRALDGDFVSVQKSASCTMRVLQESRFREEAQSNGRKFATRNKTRLDWVGGQADSTAEDGVLTNSQQRLLQSITNFVKEVEGGSEQVASATLTTLLNKRLKQCVEKAFNDVDANLAPQKRLPQTAPTGLGDTDAGRKFRAALDHSTQQITNELKRPYNHAAWVVDTYQEKTKEILKDVDAFMNEVNSSLTLLRGDMTDAMLLMSTVNTLGAAPTVDPDTLVARAVAYAEKQQWSDAFTVALESSDITVLLSFLESQVCQDNQSTITSPKTISLPLFLSLCLQLSFEMENNSGCIPLRIQLLHHFYVEWDDVLRNVQAQAAKDFRQKPTFDLIKRELGSVLESLGTLDVTALDRKSRSYFRLLSKLMRSLLEEN